MIKREMENYAIDIMGISETRWIEEGEFISGEYKVIHSKSNNGQGGVAFVLNKTSAQSLLDIKTVENRFLLARFSSSPVDLVVILVYMPASNSDEEEIEETYGKLEELLEKTRHKDNVIIMGDWYAVVGEIPEKGK